MSTTTTTVAPNRQESSDDVELVPIELQARDEQQEDSGSTHGPIQSGRDWMLLFKLISCGASFFVSGMNDGSLGALLPYVIRSYGVTTAIASSV